jgi:hypothetical protein
MACMKSILGMVLWGLGGALLGLFLIPDHPQAGEATTGLLIVGPFVGFMAAFGPRVDAGSPRGG